MSQVKWIRSIDGFDDCPTVRDWLDSEKGPKDYVPVLPLAAWQEVVDGMKIVANITDCHPIDADRRDRIHSIAQRLLALLGEGKS